MQGPTQAGTGTGSFIKVVFLVEVMLELKVEG